MFDGPGTALEYEAMSWAGDSGGPALIEDDTGAWTVAGVNSTGDCCEIGSIDNYARLGATALSWIEDNIRDSVVGFGV